MEQSIEARVGVLEAAVMAVQHDLNNDVAEIKRDLKDMRDALAGRPSWAVVMFIAGSWSVTSALGATLLTLLIKHA